MAPLRVRGRRYADERPQSSSEKKTASSKPGRPPELNSFTEDPVPYNTSIQDTQAHKRPRPSKAQKPQVHAEKVAPTLETMPNEILEAIFRHCLELNLPRASLALGKSLGSKMIYESLIIQAFSWFELHPLLGKYRASHALKDSDARELQNQIVSCRWFSPELLDQCAASFFKQAAKVMWADKGTVIDEEKDQAAFSSLLNSFDSNGWKKDSPSDAIWVRGMEDGKESWMKWEYGPGEEIRICPSRLVGGYGRSQYWNWTFPSVCSGSCIPEALCQQPFTDAKLDKLQFLARLGFGLGANATERFNSAVGEAISSDSPEALRILLGLLGQNWFLPDKVNYVPPVGWESKKRLDARHYISAATFGREALLTQLVRYDPEGHSLPRDDPHITDWALEAQKKEPETALLGGKILKMMT